MNKSHKVVMISKVVAYRWISRAGRCHSGGVEVKLDLESLKVNYEGY